MASKRTKGQLSTFSKVGLGLPRHGLGATWQQNHDRTNLLTSLLHQQREIVHSKEAVFENGKNLKAVGTCETSTTDADVAIYSYADVASEKQYADVATALPCSRRHSVHTCEEEIVQKRAQDVFQEKMFPSPVLEPKAPFVPKLSVNKPYGKIDDIKEKPEKFGKQKENVSKNVMGSVKKENESDNKIEDESVIKSEDGRDIKNETGTENGTETENDDFIEVEEVEDEIMGLMTQTAIAEEVNTTQMEYKRDSGMYYEYGAMSNSLKDDFISPRWNFRENHLTQLAKQTTNIHSITKSSLNSSFTSSLHSSIDSAFICKGVDNTFVNSNLSGISVCKTDKFLESENVNIHPTAERRERRERGERREGRESGLCDSNLNGVQKISPSRVQNFSNTNFNHQETVTLGKPSLSLDSQFCIQNHNTNVLITEPYQQFSEYKNVNNICQNMSKKTDTTYCEKEAVLQNLQIDKFGRKRRREECSNEGVKVTITRQKSNKESLENSEDCKTSLYGKIDRPNNNSQEKVWDSQEKDWSICRVQRVKSHRVEVFQGTLLMNDGIDLKVTKTFDEVKLKKEPLIELTNIEGDEFLSKEVMDFRGRGETSDKEPLLFVDKLGIGSWEGKRTNLKTGVVGVETRVEIGDIKRKAVGDINKCSTNAERKAIGDSDNWGANGKRRAIGDSDNWGTNDSNGKQSGLVTFEMRDRKRTSQRGGTGQNRDKIFCEMSEEQEGEVEVGQSKKTEREEKRFRVGPMVVQEEVREIVENSRGRGRGILYDRHEGVNNFSRGLLPFDRWGEKDKKANEKGNEGEREGEEEVGEEVPDSEDEEGEAPDSEKEEEEVPDSEEEGGEVPDSGKKGGGEVTDSEEEGGEVSDSGKERGGEIPNLGKEGGRGESNTEEKEMSDTEDSIRSRVEKRRNVYGQNEPDKQISKTEVVVIDSQSDSQSEKDKKLRFQSDLCENKGNEWCGKKPNERGEKGRGNSLSFLCPFCKVNFDHKSLKEREEHSNSCPQRIERFVQEEDKSEKSGRGFGGKFYVFEEMKAGYSEDFQGREKGELEGRDSGKCSSVKLSWMDSFLQNLDEDFSEDENGERERERAIAEHENQDLKKEREREKEERKAADLENCDLKRERERRETGASEERGAGRDGSEIEEMCQTNRRVEIGGREMERERDSDFTFLTEGETEGERNPEFILLTGREMERERDIEFTLLSDGEGKGEKPKRLITDFFGGCFNKRRNGNCKEGELMEEREGGKAGGERGRGRGRGNGRERGRFGGKEARGGEGESGEAGKGIKRDNPIVRGGRVKWRQRGRGRGRRRFMGRGTNGVKPIDGANIWEVIPGTPFRVDGFRHLSSECSHWFLTHFHTDHYQGITRGFRFGTIYCSLITAKLMELKIGVPREKIRVLPLKEKVEVEGVSVTLVDANHCPGAVMILFEPPNGEVVFHTGDFRWSPEMEEDLKTLLSSLSIHTLILDTTYCDPQYEFPRQHVVMEYVIDAIAAEAFNPKTLCLIGTYSIGKERLFLEIARALKTKIYVGSAKRRMLHCMDFTEEELQLCVTEKETETRIHAVPLWSVANFKRMESISRHYRGKYDTIVAFSPSGWSFGKDKKRGPGRRMRKGTLIRYEIPYSEHSSFTELKDFVQFMDPEIIIPSVHNKDEMSAENLVTLLSENGDEK